jgi:diamine N-acetyltransferase
MLRGLKANLREATEADRRNIYAWLAHSDVTPSMMGPPRFPDHVIPTWEDFCRDYRPYYFDGSKPNQGRCFIVVADQADVGVVCYNALRSNNMTDVDIWLRSEADCGKGFGSDALRTLTDYLNKEFGVIHIAISPSARNQRAIAAYKKAGFHLVPTEKHQEFVEPEELEYKDNVVLIKDYTHKKAGSKRLALPVLDPER